MVIDFTLAHRLLVVITIIWRFLKGSRLQGSILERDIYLLKALSG